MLTYADVIRHELAADEFATKHLSWSTGFSTGGEPEGVHIVRSGAADASSYTPYQQAIRKRNQ
jgi:hypothetical protein